MSGKIEHFALGGMTGSGKTFFGQSFARTSRRVGTGTIGLTFDPWPSACLNWQTNDPEKFLAKFEQCLRVIAFIELADADAGKFDDRWHKLATKGRHLGNKCVFIAQRAAMMHPAIRENCTGLALFRCSPRAAAVWAEEFADEAIEAASGLGQYEFIFKPNRFAPAQRLKLKV